MLFVSNKYFIFSVIKTYMLCCNSQNLCAFQCFNMYNLYVHNSLYSVKLLVVMLYFQSLMPLLLRAASLYNGPDSCNRAAIVNISSILGSIAENRSGGMYGYRPSKVSKVN